MLLTDTCKNLATLHQNIGHSLKLFFWSMSTLIIQTKPSAQLQEEIHIRFSFPVFFVRVLGRVGDEQSPSSQPIILNRWSGSRPTAPPSGGGRGGHSGGTGACPILIFNPQWRHAEDPVGCPA